MQRMRRLLVLGACLGGPLSMAWAAEKGTREEAVAMVKKAGAYLKQHGRAKALAEFMRVGGPFIVKDLYLFVYDGEGVNLAHINPKMVGKNLLDMKDADGVPLIREVIAKGNSKEGSGWTDYRWPNPITKVVEHKSSYTENFGGVYISCGVYK